MSRRGPLTTSLYVTPRTAEPVVFPKHKASASVKLEPDTFSTPIEVNRFYAPHWIVAGSGARRDSYTVITTQAEAIIEGPGVLNVESHRSIVTRESAEGTATASLLLVMAGDSHPINIELRLEFSHANEQAKRKVWKLSSARVRERLNK